MAVIAAALLARGHGSAHLVMKMKHRHSHDRPGNLAGALHEQRDSRPIR
jgi:hypothetical protein